MEVKDDHINFIIFIFNGKDCSKSIVRGISLYNELDIRDPVYKNGSRDKCLL